MAALLSPEVEAAAWVAALYVEADGVYAGLPGVDIWPIDRDARNYSGPYPVIAHSPCARWARGLWGGRPGRDNFLLGDDGGCFDRALWAVQTFRGLLELLKPGFFDGTGATLD